VEAIQIGWYRKPHKFFGNCKTFVIGEIFGEYDAKFFALPLYPELYPASQFFARESASVEQDEETAIVPFCLILIAL
jgi:hypothetical protein